MVDSHVFMFDMTGNKSCKLLKNRICKTGRMCKVKSVLSSLTTRGLLTITVLLATQTLLVFFQAYNNFILYSTEFHSLKLTQHTLFCYASRATCQTYGLQ